MRHLPNSEHCATKLVMGGSSCSLWARNSAVKPSDSAASDAKIVHWYDRVELNQTKLLLAGDRYKNARDEIE